MGLAPGRRARALLENDMKISDAKTFPERGTLVKCMGGSGVVVASSSGSSPEKERTVRDDRHMV
jgi:hypothetical protein